MIEEAFPIGLDDELFWSELLLYIKEGKVIPIIGGGLLTVTLNGVEMSVEQYIAQKLAIEFKLPDSAHPAGVSLHELVTRLQEVRNFRRESVYPRIQLILKNAPFSVPEPLNQLAQILDFRLFVSTTFDTLLERALTEKRTSAKSLAYAPNGSDDIDFDKIPHAPVTVFHLLGRVCSSPDFVVSDEDLLEFVVNLQKGKRPQRLFDILKDHHLLFIGNHFPDWLGRFFLRVITHGKLSQQRDRMEFLVDEGARIDRNLVQFISNYSYRTTLVESGPAQFVAELYRRWKEQEPAIESNSPPVNGTVVKLHSSASLEEEMGPDFIFISYASQNVKEVSRIKEQLTDAGLEVWLDKKELEVGDTYDFKIKRHIRRCGFFLPIISKVTEDRDSGYFRKEWAMGAERCLEFDDTATFALPVAIDKELPSPNDARVPDVFRKLQWSTALEGELNPNFIQKLVQLTRGRRKQTQNRL